MVVAVGVGGDGRYSGSGGGMWQGSDLALSNRWGERAGFANSTRASLIN